MDPMGEASPSRESGKLTIYFCCAPGAGAARAMVADARREKNRGRDVVVGFLHRLQAVSASAEALEQLPSKAYLSGRHIRQELDLDAALARKPGLILIEDLAHGNPDTFRHERRYQDVRELLRAGIDVYATLTVGQLESLGEAAEAITGRPARELVPDPVFDGAGAVVFVDLQPRELLEEAKDDPQWRGLSLEQMEALRLLALERCAQRVRAGLNPVSGEGAPVRKEHILACLSSSPSNAKIIRTAARMAQAFQGTFTALFVETPQTRAMGEEDKARLQAHIRLAKQLGAVIETGYGEDVPTQIAEFARLGEVTKIVIGRSTASRKNPFQGPTLTERLIAGAPNLDIHVIPDANVDGGYHEPKGRHGRPAMAWRDVAVSVLALGLASVIGYGFQQLGFPDGNIIAVFIFSILVTSILTSSRSCGLAASVVSLLVFNFFFTVPRYTIRLYDRRYLATFAVMFLAAFLTGTLAARLKEGAKQSAAAAFRTGVLLETNQLLQKAKTEWEVVHAAAGQILRLMRRDLVIYLAEGERLSSPEVYRTPDSQDWDLTTPEETEAARWVLENNKRAGAGTGTFSQAKCLYWAIRVNRRVYGVVGIQAGTNQPDIVETGLLLSILGECALALENIRIAREKEEAAIAAKNEQLRANLLRTISHDLRTPLTSISGNAGNLLANYQRMDEKTRVQTFSDIHDDAVWLNAVVENLLAVTKLEGGPVALNRSIELLDDVIAEALERVHKKDGEHIITVAEPREMLFVNVDGKLVVQVLINLIDNAMKYTPPQSHIVITSRAQGAYARISVADNGAGIPDGQKERVFDMFYTGGHGIADSRRSLGLGLYLCRTIVEAHGGTISVEDNQPQGAVFTFTLPMGEVRLHE